jgi:undecaprenyl-diphosphatase
LVAKNKRFCYNRKKQLFGGYKMTKTKKHFITSAILWVAFVLFTVLVQVVDVQPIGPQGSVVGFAGLNQWMQRTLGSHPSMDFLTDVTLLIAILAAVVTGLLGIVQFIKRKSLLKVDRSVLCIGARICTGRGVCL